MLDEQTFTELLEAARNQWAVEPSRWAVPHYIRDVKMGEDKMVTRSPKEARVIAGFTTTATNMLAGESQNLLELRERLTRNRTLVDPLFKRNKVWLNP